MFLLLVVAGNETTSQAIAHGMLALVEHRDQWERSETTRSSSGARAPTRSCAGRRPCPLPAHRHAGRRAPRPDDQAGDKVVVWYGSANFDEEVFPDPLHFDVAGSPTGTSPSAAAAALLPRSPPRQARSRVMFDQLLPRLAELELTGPPERMRTNFTNALKRMPCA